MQQGRGGDGDARCVSEGGGGPFSNTEVAWTCTEARPCTLPRPGDATALKRVPTYSDASGMQDGFRVERPFRKPTPKMGPSLGVFTDGLLLAILQMPVKLMRLRVKLTRDSHGRIAKQVGSRSRRAGTRGQLRAASQSLGSNLITRLGRGTTRLRSAEPSPSLAPGRCRPNSVTVARSQCL